MTGVLFFIRHNVSSYHSLFLKGLVMIDPDGWALVEVGSVTSGRALNMWPSAGQGLESKFHVS